MPLRVPVILISTLGAGASSSLDFTQKMGTAHVRIVGIGPVFMKFDGTPGAVAAAGQTTLDAQVPFYNVDDIEFRAIGFYAVGAARVEVTAYRSVEGKVIR